MRNIAVILAGGSGQRLGENIPKQFLKIAGKKVIEHTITVFQNHSLIDEIVVVVHPVFRLRSSSVFVQQQQLCHHIGIVGNGVTLLLVSVECAIHVFHDVCDGVVAFRQFVAVSNF